MLWVVKKGLGLKILTFALVIMLWVDVIGLDFGIVVGKKVGIHDDKKMSSRGRGREGDMDVWGAGDRLSCIF